MKERNGVKDSKGRELSTVAKHCHNYINSIIYMYMYITVYIHVDVQ